MKVELLPVQHVAAVEAATELPWLAEGLWLEHGVGFLGGHPKSCKSWVALDIALSVASRTPVFGQYPVPRGGPVLVFAAEDAPPMVRARFAGMAAARQVALEDVPIQLVLANSLRLESEGDQARLRATVENRASSTRSARPCAFACRTSSTCCGTSSRTAVSVASAAAGRSRPTSRLQPTTATSLPALKRAAEGKRESLEERAADDLDQRAS